MAARVLFAGAYRSLGDIEALLEQCLQARSYKLDARDLAKRAQAVRAQTYHRDADGQFASTGGGSDSGDDENGPDLGDHGYGVAPDGSSYGENDVDENGGPRFSQEYRAKYGNIENDHRLGDSSLSLVEPSKGKIHIADDSRGTTNRDVIQEFTRKQAVEVGATVYTVYSGMRNSETSRTGIRVEATTDDPRSNGVKVTFPSGHEVFLDGEAGKDAAFDFQEALMLAGGEG